MSPMISKFGCESLLVISSVVRSSYLVAAGEMKATETESSPKFIETNFVLSDLYISTVSLSILGFQASPIPPFTLRLFPVGSSMSGY